jgi:hypothetical protein
VILPLEVSPEQMSETLQNGSPMLINAAGRMLGLGDAEQSALAAGGIPKTALVVLGLVGGVLAGLYVGKRWPSITRRVFG